MIVSCFCSCADQNRAAEVAIKSVMLVGVPTAGAQENYLPRSRRCAKAASEAGELQKLWCGGAPKEQFYESDGAEISWWRVVVSEKCQAISVSF